MVQELGEEFEVVLSVPDLRTEARLVLARSRWRTGHHLIGWQNWNGLRADGSAKLRWAEHRRGGEDEAVARFHALLDQGPRRLKTPKRRDFQASRFGRWLDETVLPLYDDPEMTLDEAQAFVSQVWREQGQRWFPPTVENGRGCRSALYYPGVPKIALPKWARRRPMILVTLAHGLVREARDHGPLYVRKVVELHVRYLGRKEIAMVAELKDYKVEIAPPPK